MRPPGVRPGFVSGTVFTNAGAAGGSGQVPTVCSETEFRCDDGGNFFDFLDDF